MAGRGDLETLVELARKGSSAAWGRVYETLAPSVFRICRRVLASREDAEDATSEIFLKARVRLASYESSRPFTPWLYRVAANHCWDEIRKRRTRAEVDDGEPELSALEDEAPTPQEAVLAIEEPRFSPASAPRIGRPLPSRRGASLLRRHELRGDRAGARHLAELRGSGASPRDDGP